jgi:hypothetical protein
MNIKLQIQSTLTSNTCKAGNISISTSLSSTKTGGTCSIRVEPVVIFSRDDGYVAWIAAQHAFVEGIGSPTHDNRL